MSPPGGRRLVVTRGVFAIEQEKEFWGRKWLTHRTDGRSRRCAAQKLNHTATRYDALLSSITQTPHAMLSPLPFCLNLLCAPANTALVRKSCGPPPSPPCI